MELEDGEEDALEDELEGESEGEGMLFILEHFFAFKRLARLWRKRRALQSPALAIPSPPLSPVTLGASTVPLTQNKMKRTSELACREVPSYMPIAAATSTGTVLGGAHLERQGRRRESATACDWLGTRELLASGPASHGLDPLLPAANENGFSLLSLNMKGSIISEKQAAGLDHLDCRTRSLLSTLQLWHRPALVALQELGGGQASVDRMAAELVRLGYDVAARAAAASHAVRAAFIELVADKVQSLTIDTVSGTVALPFAIAGDWNASPMPAARRNGSPNDAHDEALFRRWFGGSDGDAFSAPIPSGLQKEVDARRRQLNQAINLGIGEPCSAQEFTERMHERLRSIRQRKSAQSFQLCALSNDDGTIERRAGPVHALAHSYGVTQNRLSASDDEAFGVWLDMLVPAAPILTLPSGAPWSLRAALPVAVLRREARKQRKGKARAFNPFIIEMLQCLPEGHPAEAAYFELLLRCMEEGVYPAHYLQIVAVLIPKKASGLLQMAQLRDIWLINHAGAQAMRHYGVPEQAIRALRGLVENWKHGVAQGRYETAFGATDPFPILRGFLQGAQGSPEACKLMMDTIAQALELKVSGYTAFAPDGAGGEMGTLIFVDDAANATGDAFFLHRVTLFWSIWSRITDCQLNIKGNNKTVVQSLEYKRGKDGTLIPVETRQRFYISAVSAGDLPRLIPNLLVTEHYLYCGMATRMDGRHNEIGLSTLRSKLAACGAQATTAPTSRRLALGCAGLGIYGNAFFYGACFGGSFETVEARLGPTYGLRQLDYGPRGIYFGAVFEFLRLDDIIERPLWLLCQLGLTFCHTLATGGIAELANLCDEENFDFLDEASILAAHPRALELGAAQAKRELHALMGAIRACHISPVPGRSGWAMADAADGIIPTYAPAEFGLLPQLGLADLAARKRSGDGGSSLAAQLCVINEPPPLKALLELLPREYAIGPDPFRCSKLVRVAAFGEVSHDFDDAVSFPTAQQALFPSSLTDRGSVVHMRQSAILIAHAAAVRAAVGRHFLREDLLGAAEVYGRAKILLSAVENGASCEAWLRRQPPGDVNSYGVAAELFVAPSVTFNLSQFAREQDARARWLTASQPHLVQYVGLLNSLMLEGARDSELTAKSYVLQDYEGASRRAKCEWARRWQAEVINLQHDGATGTAGPSQLDLDGATRRAIFFYDSKLPTEELRLAYRFDDSGRLRGNPAHPDCPLAARFWWECQLVCDKARKTVKRKECLFVFDKLLELESEYPITHFVATDGSKDIHEETGAVRVSRVCLAVAQGSLGCSVLGGQLDVYADTFERHSYEAELAAFHDHLAATKDSVTVVVTDCLSGMQAGHAFTGRTVSSKAARYRDKELGNISELERRQRAVLYVHIHSHDGVTPNEAADATAKFMLDSALLPLDLMPSAHTKCRVAGVKR
eukprot:jgi/Chrpa1/11538/Chrysochromulina_OHIO_Genome00019369-RA